MTRRVPGTALGHECVFTYGTLSFPEVMGAITGRRLASEEATLPGFARRLVRGRAYPGIRPAPGEATDGRLWSGVCPASLDHLDRYEGDLYERRRVSVRTAAGALAMAWAYVVREELRHLLAETDWRPERFAARHLPAAPAGSGRHGDGQ